MSLIERSEKKECFIRTEHAQAPIDNYLDWELEVFGPLVSNEERSKGLERAMQVQEEEIERQKLAQKFRKRGWRVRE